MLRKRNVVLGDDVAFAKDQIRTFAYATPYPKFQPRGLMVHPESIAFEIAAVRAAGKAQTNGPIPASALVSAERIQFDPIAKGQAFEVDVRALEDGPRFRATLLGAIDR